MFALIKSTIFLFCLMDDRLKELMQLFSLFIFRKSNVFRNSLPNSLLSRSINIIQNLNEAKINENVIPKSQSRVTLKQCMAEAELERCSAPAPALKKEKSIQKVRNRPDAALRPFPPRGPVLRATYSTQPCTVANIQLSLKRLHKIRNIKTI